MNISNEKLKTFICGAVRFEENNGWLQAYRFTKKQKEYCEAYTPEFNHKVSSTASISVDFYTDTQNISFLGKVSILSAQAKYSVDVYVDGVMQEHFSKHNVTEEEREFSFSLKEGRKRVTIYMPYLCSMKVKNFVIDDNAYMEPVKKDRNIIFFGDSITQGYIAEFTSLTYPNILARKLNADILNQAIAGDVFNCENLDEDLEFEADTVVIAYGTNDWSKGCDLRKTAFEYFRKLVAIYPTQKIYVVLPIWRADIERKEGGQKIPFFEAREIVKSISEKYENVTVIESIDFVPHYADFFEDAYLHPNDLGFLLYSENLNKVIK